VGLAPEYFFQEIGHQSVFIVTRIPDINHVIHALQPHWRCVGDRPFELASARSIPGFEAEQHSAAPATIALLAPKSDSLTNHLLALDAAMVVLFKGSLPAGLIEPEDWLTLPIKPVGWKLAYRIESATTHEPLSRLLVDAGDVRAWLPADCQAQRQAVERSFHAHQLENNIDPVIALARKQRQRQLEGWLNNIASEHEALLSSWRWRCGHWLITLVEKLLRRKPVPLATDRISGVLKAFRASRHQAGLLDMQTRIKSMWHSDNHAIAAAVSDYQPVLERECSFSTVIKKLIDVDPGSGKKLSEKLQEADAELSRQVRDFSGVQTPLVSIIMPAWQRASIIEQAVRSVIEQRLEYWELLVCDDGSSDGTDAIIKSIDDSRIRYLNLEHKGAAAARNAGLAASKGELIAYLDTDNLWHPEYLGRIVQVYMEQPDTMAIACDYLDVEQLEQSLRLRDRNIDFRWEQLVEENFIDLNTFSHRRCLFEVFGGFTDALPRRQDWDLVLKYLFRFDPAVINQPLCLYRRNQEWSQLTQTQDSRTEEAHSIIQANLARYYQHGCLDPDYRPNPRRVTVIVWDICRNHLSKAWNIAEALSEDHDVQLIGFRFFDEPIFPPYKTASAPFETRFFDGCDFPEFENVLAEALLAISGDIIYCVKPRLPSFGLALLANYHFGTPVICESNDLESSVTRPGNNLIAAEAPDAGDPDFLNPYHDRWTAWMEDRLRSWPHKATHNSIHDAWLGGGCHRVMNIKDEHYFNPAKVTDRNATRRKLGIARDEFVLLFGGLVRRHKGVFELLEFVRQKRSEGKSIRLMVVGSRASPEYTDLLNQAGGCLTVIEPQDRNAMAAVNVAADAVLLWLNPTFDASHHQMPFKMTDALAMEVPVLASPVGDLAELAERGIIKAVPFGDTAALDRAIERLKSDPEFRQALVDRGRALYLRRFTYQALREQFACIAPIAGVSGSSHPIAVDFGHNLELFLRAIRPSKK
jgi:glycosyltransferase involved in cell wall biosynthesis